jgi:hypothetical protein
VVVDQHRHAGCGIADSEGLHVVDFAGHRQRHDGAGNTHLLDPLVDRSVECRGEVYGWFGSDRWGRHAHQRDESRRHRECCAC